MNPGQELISWFKLQEKITIVTSINEYRFPNFQWKETVPKQVMKDWFLLDATSLFALDSVKEKVFT